MRQNSSASAEFDSQSISAQREAHLAKLRELDEIERRMHESSLSLPPAQPGSHPYAAHQATSVAPSNSLHYNQVARQHQLRMESRDMELARTLALQQQAEITKNDEELARSLVEKDRAAEQRRLLEQSNSAHAKAQQRPVAASLDSERRRAPPPARSFQTADRDSKSSQVSQTTNASAPKPSPATVPSPVPAPVDSSPLPLIPPQVAMRTEVHKSPEALDTFLNRLVPSQLFGSGAKIKLVVRNPADANVSMGWDESKFNSLRTQWEEWQNPRSSELPSSAEQLFKMCLQRRLLTGRWILISDRANLDSMWSAVAKAVHGGLGVEAVVELGDLTPEVPICIRTRDIRDAVDVYNVFAFALALGSKRRLVYYADVVYELHIPLHNQLGPNRSDVRLHFYSQIRKTPDDIEDFKGASIKTKFAKRLAETKKSAASSSGFGVLASSSDDGE